MRATRSVSVIAACAALSVLAACSTGADNDEPDSSSSPGQAQGQSPSPTPEEPRATEPPDYTAEGVTARVLPQLAATISPDTESADQAAWVVEATVAGGEAGTEVELHAKSGGEWSVVDSGATGEHGHITLTSTVPGALHVVAGAEGQRKGTRVGTGQTSETIFRDDFDTNTVNVPGGKWFTRAQGHVGVRLCSEAVDEAAKVVDGVLRLSVLKDPNRGTCPAVEGNHDYRLNGHVGTQETFSFLYGYTAARIKFPKERGQHGAFWMQSMDVHRPLGPHLGGAEIDVIEYFGDNHPVGGLTSFSYWLGTDNEKKMSGGWVENPEQYGEGWSENYHVYSLEWTPAEYIFRIDGQITKRLPGPTAGVNEYLILSLLSSDYELKQFNGKLPVHMDVDWVRTWEASPTG